MALGVSMLPSLALALPALGRRRKSFQLDVEQKEALWGLSDDIVKEMQEKDIVTSQCSVLSDNVGRSVHSRRAILCPSKIPENFDMILMGDPV